MLNKQQPKAAAVGQVIEASEEAQAWAADVIKAKLAVMQSDLSQSDDFSIEQKDAITLACRVAVEALDEMQIALADA